MGVADDESKRPSTITSLRGSEESISVPLDRPNPADDSDKKARCTSEEFQGFDSESQEGWSIKTVVSQNVGPKFTSRSDNFEFGSTTSFLSSFSSPPNNVGKPALTKHGLSAVYGSVSPNTTFYIPCT